MMISELFTGKKGLPMDKINKRVYGELLCLFSGFLFVALIFCSGVSVCAGDGESSIKVDFVGRYISDGLLLYSELKNESGIDFIRARKTHADLLGRYLREMKSRQLEYAANLLTEQAASIESILKELRAIKEGLGKAVPPNAQDPNDWAKDNIEKASKRFGELLIGFEPYLETPFDIDGFEKLGDECRKELRKALKDVTAKLNVYIKDLTTKKANDLLIKRAAGVCQANRKAIMLLFIFRFARFEDPEVNAETSGEGFDVRTIRQLTGDINRTIYWNRVLQKRLEEKDALLLRKYTASELEEKDALLLRKYTASENRRLRVVKAILGRDMREAQGLLLKTLIKSPPLKTISDENIELP